MRRWVAALVVLCALLFGASAHASPVDAERPVAPTDGWSGSVDGRAALSAGNVDRVDLGGAAAVHWQSFFDPRPDDPLPFLRSRWTSLADGALATLGDRRFVQRSFAHTRFTHMPHRRIGIDGFAQVQADAFTRLRLRIITGVGGRVVAVHRRAFQLWGGLAYMPEYERNDTLPGDPHPARTVNHRGTSYASFLLRPFSEGSLALRSTLYAQPRLDDPSDLRLLHHVRLEASAAPRLTIGFETQVVHDTRPPRGVAPTDLTVRSVLRLRIP